MPNVYKPRLVQIRPQWNDSGPDTPECVLWYQGTTDGPYGFTALAAIGAQFDGVFGPGWAAVGANPDRYTGSVVTDWTSATGGSFGTTASVNGTAGAPIGNNTALLTSFKIEQRYKGGHPRNYLPALGVTDLDSGDTFLTGAITSVTNLWTDLAIAMAAIGGGDGGPWAQAIYRERNNPVTAALWPVLEVIVQSQIASQRRRGRKVGRA